MSARTKARVATVLIHPYLGVEDDSDLLDHGRDDSLQGLQCWLMRYRGNDVRERLDHGTSLSGLRARNQRQISFFTTALNA
jgi:hypothetical protein